MGTIVKSMRRAIFLAFFLVSVAGSLPAFAALPFITDDAGTLGKGVTQVELWYVGNTDKETVSGSSVKTEQNLPGATLGHGVAEKVDLTVGLARVWGDTTVDGVSSSDAGSAFFTLSAKWRFFENAGVSFALKPLVGYSYLVGGTGSDYATSFGGWLIVTKEHEALAVSLNAGYLFNDYGSAAERDASRSGIWQLSALATYEVLAGLKLGLDVGAFTNPDKASSEMKAYAMGGAIYSPNRNVDLSLGFKFGITKPEPDFAGIAGVTLRF